MQDSFTSERCYSSVFFFLAFNIGVYIFGLFIELVLVFKNSTTDSIKKNIPTKSIGNKTTLPWVTPQIKKTYIFGLFIELI
jgi:hypothetical protein